MDEYEIRIDPAITTAGSEFVSPEKWNSFHKIDQEGGGGLTVAVMDSGIDDTHPMFEYFNVDVRHPKIDGLPTNGEDNVGHGTAVAGALVNLAPHIDKLLNVPIFGDSGRTGFDRIRVAYDWLIEHSDKIDMVNMSWGAAQKVQPIDTLHNELEQTGVDAIVAAGNTDRQTGSPATASRAFAVAACTVDEKMTRWSSPTDNVTALGRNIAMPSSKDGAMGRQIPESNYSPVMEKIGGEWIKASGTSFSAPGVLGMAATFRTENTSMARKDVKKPFEKRFMATAEDIKGTDEDGVGYVNYNRAVEGEPKPTISDATVWSLPWGSEDFIHVNYDALEDGKYDVNIEELREAFQAD